MGINRMYKYINICMVWYPDGIYRAKMIQRGFDRFLDNDMDSAGKKVNG